MKVLALDSSSTVAAAAVMDDGQLLGEYSINDGRTHSTKLMPIINDLLNRLGIMPEDIDLFAAANGPGSFTGLRIGVTTAKALAYALGKPVIGVPTLDAFAYNIVLDGIFTCPIMDARNNQVYTALYKCNDRYPERITEYMGLPIEELVEIIKEKNIKVIFVGDGVEKHREYLKKQLGDKCGFPPEHLLLMKGSSVAKAAIDMASGGILENCFDMVPFYLRKSQAEREYEKRISGNS